MIESTKGKIEGLKHAIAICDTRSLPMYNAGYKACAADIKIFLEASIERLERGEGMNSESVAQDCQSSQEVLYFGCLGQSGYYLKSKLNPKIRYEETAWGNELDGGLFPNRGPGYADGILHVEHKDGWTGIALADNSVDTRPGSHSTFVVHAEMTGDRLLELAKAQWPEVFGRKGFPVVRKIVSDEPPMQ